MQGFNPLAEYPYALRADVFAIAMSDIYELLATINASLMSRGLLRIEESVRGAVFSGLLSDLVTVSLASHANGLTKNTFHNGHPDLLPVGRYTDDAAQSAEEGVEVKVTKRPGGAVDMHGARPAWLCVLRWEVDDTTQPVVDRAPTRFTDIWLYQCSIEDFRHNARSSSLGTRTSTLDRDGLARMRERWVYHID